MSGYSLKTFREGVNGNHLKNWVIEGKNEGEEWKEIDREDNFDLNGPSYEHYYPLSKTTEAYLYIRIKSIGRTHSKVYYYIGLDKVEIYGRIIEEQS